MIRVTISFETEDEGTAVEALERCLEMLEDGHTEVSLNNGDTLGKMEVEALCEYCDGERFIEGKKCFNCNEEDHDPELSTS